jgi:hypothetical protein
VKSAATDNVDRIAVYVPYGDSSVRFADDRLTPVPGVEERPSSLRATVVALSMDRLDPADRLGKIRTFPLQEPMEMVGHQSVGPEDCAGAFEAIQHDLLEVEPVSIKAKDVLPIDAAVDDVKEVGGAEISVSFGHASIHWVT